MLVSMACCIVCNSLHLPSLNQFSCLQMELTLFALHIECFEIYLLQLLHKSTTIKVIVLVIFRNSLCEVLKHISNASRILEDPLSHWNSFNELLEVAQYMFLLPQSFIACPYITQSWNIYLFSSEPSWLQRYKGNSYDWQHASTKIWAA